jgi:flagellar hook-associated protein 1 FlgK
VATINQIAGQIAALNGQIQSDPASSTDAGLDAQIHTALESLSQVANFTAIQSADGGFNVYLGGQAALVLGQNQYAIQAGFSSGQTTILDSQGNDITSQISQGSLGALIQEGNTTLPGYLNQLNTLAQTFADQVNQVLTNGVDQNGTPGTNLFIYDQSSDAASTLAVTGITSDQIAAATSAAPGGNGNALAVAQLATQPLVNGSTFDQAYGTLGGQVGSDVNTATQNQTQYQDTLTQAQQLRSTQTGVNLNAEAAKLLQYQQAYQAAGSLFTTLNSLTQTVIDLIPLGVAT